MRIFEIFNERMPIMRCGQNVVLFITPLTDSLLLYYKTGITQVTNILKSLHMERMHQLRVASDMHDVDELTCLMVPASQIQSTQLPVSGPMLLEKGKTFAAAAGKVDFKASNGYFVLM
jgi:hypothetical protein